MQVFVKVNGELRKYTYSGDCHKEAISQVAMVTMNEFPMQKAMPLALIQGGKQ